jgi:hypothetical protein
MREEIALHDKLLCFARITAAYNTANTTRCMPACVACHPLLSAVVLDLFVYAHPKEGVRIADFRSNFEVLLWVTLGNLPFGYFEATPDKGLEGD